MKSGNLVPGFNGNNHRCAYLKKEECMKYFDQLMTTYRNPGDFRKRRLSVEDQSQKRIRLVGFDICSYMKMIN